LNTGSTQNFGVTNQPTPIFVGPNRYGNIDSIERSRLPDFVGVVRLDHAWGSAQLSAATHALNVGNLSTAASTGTGAIVAAAHTSNVQGFAVQGALKINTPFIAPGDALYLQGAYGEGAQL
ncbi:porin, partial [Methylobacterium sp. J-026]|uniref:porin n=1 Tax=Methylobacterium sp. J-026 TaxID=2836624 RepID=UPI001FBBC586